MSPMSYRGMKSIHDNMALAMVVSETREGSVIWS